jgi:hypothetical protein
MAKPTGTGNEPDVSLTKVIEVLHCLAQGETTMKPAGLFTAVLGILVSCSPIAAQITCASGSACQANFIPVFASNGGNAKVTDSLIQQSGSSVTVNGTVSAASYQISGTPFAFGSASFGNAFLGFAGNSNTLDRGGDTAVGPQALASIISAGGNTAVGYGALFSNTANDDNTAVGLDALYETTGAYSTGIGTGAGVSNVTGVFNTFLGSLSNADSPGLYNATAIGAYAHTAESNTVVLGGTGSYAASVGIGTASPYYDYGLTVTGGGQNNAINGGVVVNATGGNLYLGMTNGTHKFRVDTNGAVYADGGLYSSGADFAESVAVRGKLSQYSPGDVLEIDQGADRHLALSSHSYATLVAGIYSTKPGVLASLHHIDNESPHANEVPLAIVGIVPCKVSAENGPIRRGDLLVTSSTPGYAMKATDRQRMIGAVLGKALQPLAQGEGTIEVLVTLQ